jgi:xylulokinase
MFLLVKDFIRLRLTGTLATDPSDAGGTRLYDPRSGDWSQRLLEAIGVPPEKMPPICDATHIAGGVTEKAARATGLAPGTPVVVGSGDVRCTLIGANALGSARACLYLGTAAWISLPPQKTAGGRLSANCFGATSTTGAALKWLLTLFDRTHPDSPSDAYAALLQEAEGVPLGARGLIFLPHLMGERGPQHEPEAVGVLFGLTLAHERGDVARAVLEGCAFQLRHIVEDLNPHGVEEMVVVGGGAKSTLWLSIIADVLRTTLLIPHTPEAGALGAAILAGVGVGAYPDVQAAAEKLVQIEGQIEPDEARHERYGQIYSVFLELETRVAPLYGSVPAA